ncbi:uncharacterized protein TRIREDRAFT_22035 [Trichoderma reesei QM6a]|uniref:Predicted protein n=1 Tax=Hypocrea jecorina (strain QM6a) TaxID=431241 RepID=G0RGF6_HYPJQ|nr:uncharacterized protein TRIREDRAFT_22035 [Trichoderma reesei QM6a]EGR49849.1 predicted protein [Trichoderma reesei QM6a]
MNTPAFENAPTPHAIAARRALDQRRLATFTPGRSRRQSFREQRETPMLILRNLGRALAPTSNVIASSSSPDKVSADGNDDDLACLCPWTRAPRTTYSLHSRRSSTTATSPSSRLSCHVGPSAKALSVSEEAPRGPGDPEIADLRRPIEAHHGSDFSFDMPEGLDDDNDQTTFYMRSPVIDDIHSILKAPNPVADDISLMHAKSREGMEAITQIDFETLGREPEKPDDDVMGYPHGRPKKKKRARISRHNIEYPQLPAVFVRQVAHTAMQTTGFINQRISADTLEALTQASDWYFEQLGDDLAAYANHANRRTIEERDVITLMNR